MRPLFHMISGQVSLKLAHKPNKSNLKQGAALSLPGRAALSNRKALSSPLSAISSRALSVFFSKASVRQCPAAPQAHLPACYAIQHHRFGSPPPLLRLYVVLHPWTKQTQCDF
uniref:Uncharacterized protein n=1 Tax=Treubia lacunosa TaxID=93845 RepID=G4Y9S3_9MARC|nr:hypothetical protein TrlaMp24 [Treubia lacunosa]AEH99719.1 hypothetical protein TrlaMp24 [Treubia lacunosa]